MPSLISCGAINKNIIYIIIGGLGKIFAELIYKLDDKITSHPFMIGIASALGMCLSIIPYIFLKIKTRNLNKTYHNIENLIAEEINEKEKNKNKNKSILCHKYLLILASAFLDFSQKILSYLFVDDIDYNFWIFDMVFLSLFSFLILKSKLYIHQYVTLIIMVILGVSLNVINLYEVIDKNRWKNIGLVLTIEVIYSLINVINKYAMEYCFCVPYEISFYQGLFSLIINIILLVIFTNKNIENNNKYQKIDYKEKKYLDNFYQYIENIDITQIFVFIVIMICRLCFNLFSNITVKFYTPSHVALILLIGEIIFIFIDYYDDNQKIWQLIANIIIFIICLFMLLIYTEIIELNFCGLEKNTRKNIAERADKTSDNSNDSNDQSGLDINSDGSGEKKEANDSSNNSISENETKNGEEKEMLVFETK